MASNLEARSILQGLFDKWNGKSEEVIKEAKVEETILPLNLIRVGNHRTKDGRLRINLGFNLDGKQYVVSSCWPNDESKFKREYKKLVKQGKSLGDIKEELNKKYSLRYAHNKQFVKEVNLPKAPMKWNKKGRLLFYGEDTNLTPYNLDVICSLHANYDNPFTFGDYVLQNLPRALPSAVFYLCENYDMIPKLSSEGKKILDKR